MVRVGAVVWAAWVAAAALAKGGASSKKPPAKTRGVKRNSAMHAKASSKKGSSSSSSSSKKKRVYDEDDEEDDEDDAYSAMTPYYRPRRKPTGPSVWQRAQEMAKVAANQAMSTAKVAAAKGKVLTSEAATKASEATRLAKAYYSSDYEQFLLKATWPNDARVEPELAKKLVDSVAHFPARPRTLPQDDPYRVTLRKLWKKMVEKDWRTTMKALYLLHSLSRSTPLKNSRALARTLKSMLADADPKTGRKFFNRRDLVALKPEAASAEPHQRNKGPLVEAYAGYVLRRALLFAAKFEDVTAPAASKKKQQQQLKCDGDDVCYVGDDDALALKRAENALLVLEHAAQFATVALADADGPRNAHLVVVSALELVVHDIRDAWKLAAASLNHFAAKRALAEGVDAEDVVEQLQKYEKLKPRLAKLLKTSAKTLRFFDLKISSLAEPPGPDLDAAITSWTGKTPAEHDAAAAAAEAEEEEEEEEEEDEAADDDADDDDEASADDDDDDGPDENADDDDDDDDDNDEDDEDDDDDDDDDF